LARTHFAKRHDAAGRSPPFKDGVFKGRLIHQGYVGVGKRFFKQRRHRGVSNNQRWRPCPKQCFNIGPQVRLPAKLLPVLWSKQAADKPVLILCNWLLLNAAGYALLFGNGCKCA